VTLSRGFWMQQTELTQHQYQQLMGCNPAFYKGDQNPVESVTWTEATEFARRLSELPPEKKAGNVFRLPTEAEWEYACRAGSTTLFSQGDDEEQLQEVAWFHDNSARTTHPVGEKKPNAWGLHDMHGNVSEWCQDFYGDYSRDAVTDPRGPESGEKRSLRGGGWFQVSMWARSSHRDAFIPSARYVGLGFRLVATARPSHDGDRPEAQ
jgi:formylglycine-generating enzyme required for sulfatase activity